ncbi:MAG: hypothetical protein KAJ05_09820, partial [Candidatus Latescibacteria bacterium]|nr:hypothetical protein [Candidatus Latescibacterota bacterium]
MQAKPKAMEHGTHGYHGSNQVRFGGNPNTSPKKSLPKKQDFAGLQCREHGEEVSLVFLSDPGGLRGEKSFRELRA